MILESQNGSHGGRFDSYNLAGNLAVYFVKGFHQSKIKKSKKSNHQSLPFFIKDRLVIAELAMGGLKQSNRLHKADWLGGFCVLYRYIMLSSYIYCNIFDFGQRVGFFSTGRCLSGCALFSHRNKNCPIQHYHEKYQYHPYHQLPQTSGDDAQILLTKWIIHFRFSLLYQKSVYQKIIYSNPLLVQIHTGNFTFLAENSKHIQKLTSDFFSKQFLFCKEFNKKCMLFHRSHTLKGAK